MAHYRAFMMKVTTNQELETYTKVSQDPRWMRRSTIIFGFWSLPLNMKEANHLSLSIQDQDEQGQPVS